MGWTGFPEFGGLTGFAESVGVDDPHPSRKAAMNGAPGRDDGAPGLLEKRGVSGDTYLRRREGYLSRDF